MGAARAWLDNLVKPWRRQVHARPTAEGGWFLLVLLGVLIAALNTGNNLLYLVLGTQLALLVVSNALAEWNLRGLVVTRRLPEELHAREPGAGAFLVRNERRWGAAWGLHLDELDGGEARALLLRVGPGELLTAPARWTFPTRGEARLGRLRVWSAWPFGFVRRWRDLELPAALIVYPAVGPALAGPATGLHGGARERLDRAGRSGDFRGLRGYAPGDAIKDLHWPTTARTGQPMVVERGAEGAEEVVVEVPERAGEAWERALSEATGQVIWHLRAGHAVGLQLGRERLPPGAGDAARRRLLSRLALAPARGGP